MHQRRARVPSMITLAPRSPACPVQMHLSAALATVALFAVAAPAQEEPGPMRAMTFNIRYGTANDGEHDWAHRRRAVIEVIRTQRPHLLGVQEALAFQRDELAAALSTHEVIGVGREGGDRGELSALFVDRERFEIVDSGTFWLSESPDVVGSKGWDAALPRICTWAYLRDRQAERPLRVFNTHFDHRGTTARTRSAEQLAARIGGAAEATAHGPALLMGDLNAAEDSPPIRALLEAGLIDTFAAVQPSDAPRGTFTDFERVRGNRKIDYVFATPGIEILDAAIVRHRRGGAFPSDHLPVVATLGWPWAPAGGRHP